MTTELEAGDYFAILSAAVIPPVVLFIPNFVLIKDLGWLNTLQGMATPTFAVRRRSSAKA